MAEIRDAMYLRRGDRIRTSGGVTTVTRPTTRGEHDTVELHTELGDILTTSPCPVEIVEDQ
jgi:hypothetical protein